MRLIKFWLREFSAKKVNTFLVAISIAIGVFSVMLIDIISTNSISIINSELDSLGLSGVSITCENSDITYLNNDDLMKLKREKFVESATPIITANGFLKYSNINKAIICGIDENAKSVISLETTKGRKVNCGDIATNKNVCLIDDETAEKIFATNNVLGRKIDIFISGNTKEFEIIGIVKASSSLLQSSIGELLPTIIYVPYTTLQSELGNGKIDQIALNVSKNCETQNSLYINNQIKSVLHKNSDVLKINNLNNQRDGLNKIMTIITAVLRLISGVSLLVSGLGIVTIMLMRVSEKTVEIGIKKSIGATKGHIAAEFLFESLFISILGFFIGLIICFVLVIAAQIIFKIDLTVNWVNILIIFFISIFCGGAFGIYPALKAANLLPIDALRKE